MIRAKDEARFIGETLQALLDPRAPRPLQVVVVDSGSTDGTQEIVRAFPQVTFLQIRTEDFTYGYALNLAISHAGTPDVVASLSAHSLPTSPEWLRNIARPFRENPAIAGVFGRQLPRANATPLELLGMRLTGLLSDRPRLLSTRPLFSNANGAFRYALWRERPFDEKVGGAEDIAWARTMQGRGYLIAYEPSAAVYHSHGEPLTRHLRRAARDIPTVIGNVLHLGSAEGKLPGASKRAVPIVRPGTINSD